jgi:uncharacterized membrane-anchored protein YhcB (DUF1043 family)
MTQQYSTEMYQLLALIIALVIGIVFIRAHRKKELPKCIDMPTSKCQNDFTSIMGCIEDSTTNEQLEKLTNTSRTFFKLHYTIDGANSEVITCYSQLQNIIDKKKSEINAVTEVW